MSGYNEISPPRELGSTEPTHERLMTARRLLAMHVRVCVPEEICHHCLKSWPCADVRWATVVKHRAGGLDA
jgi:hypothetical protein